MKTVLAALALALLAAPALSQTDAVPTWMTDPPNPLNLTVTGAEDRALEAIVGPDGGRFELEDAAGNRLTLSFPEGAFLTDTAIRMTPIADSGGLPEGAQPIVGLLLEPDGLLLARDAVLEIQPVAEIAPGDRLHWGFYGGGEDAFLHIPDLAAEGIVIPIAHFSGAGVSFADRINMQMDRWRQSALEDRISTQIAERFREHKREGTAISFETSAALEDGRRLISDGFRRLARQPGATCADIARVAAGVLGVTRQGQLIGLESEVDQAVFADMWDKYWSLCFPEKVRLCLGTGDIAILVQFALQYERQRQIASIAGDHTGILDPGRAAELRQAMESCGRYRLEVRADGRWSDPSDVAGNLSFSVDVPLRLEFTEPDFLKFVIYGEAPATEVHVTFKDDACWRFHGHRNGGPMKAKVRNLEFRRDDTHGPLRLAIEMTAPEIYASISCDCYQMEPPISPMVWAVAHRAERTGEVFRPTHWKPGSHPRLFTSDWTGQGTDDGLLANDTTKLTFVHIGE